MEISLYDLKLMCMRERNLNQISNQILLTTQDLRNNDKKNEFGDGAVNSFIGEFFILSYIFKIQN